MKKSELFTQKMIETFNCHPYADAPIQHSEGVYLSDVYDSYSDAKSDAYNYCKRLCKEFYGFDFKIVSHNCMTFCVQFKFKNPLNGRSMLAHITRYNNHLYFV